MKNILFPILKGRLYFQKNSNHNYKEQIYSPFGANLLTLTGYFISEFKNIIPYIPTNVSANKINEDELKYFDKLCKDAEIILMQPPLPINSFVNKYQLTLLSLIAFKYKEKIRVIFDDPMDIWNIKTMLNPNPSIFSEFNLSRYRK